jgi:hypothetical protein
MTIVMTSYASQDTKQPKFPLVPHVLDVSGAVNNGLLLERLIGGPGLPCGAPVIVALAAKTIRQPRATHQRSRVSELKR